MTISQQQQQQQTSKRIQIAQLIYIAIIGTTMITIKDYVCDQRTIKWLTKTGFFSLFVNICQLFFIFMISIHIMQSLYVCRSAQEKIAQEINKKKKKEKDLKMRTRKIMAASNDKISARRNNS
jgi:hypothetical protein